MFVWLEAASGEVGWWWIYADKVQDRDMISNQTLHTVSSRHNINNFTFIIHCNIICMSFRCYTQVLKKSSMLVSMLSCLYLVLCHQKLYFCIKSTVAMHVKGIVLVFTLTVPAKQFFFQFDDQFLFCDSSFSSRLFEHESNHSESAAFVYLV